MPCAPAGAEAMAVYSHEPRKGVCGYTESRVMHPAAFTNTVFSPSTWWNSRTASSPPQPAHMAVPAPSRWASGRSFMRLNAVSLMAGLLDDGVAAAARVPCAAAS